MKKLIKKLENIMVAITFAEAGEYDEVSRQIDVVPENEQMSRPLQGHEKAAYGSTGK